MTLGSTNSSLYQGDINYVNLVSQGYWLIPLQGISVGSFYVGVGTPNVAIDTGVSLTIIAILLRALMCLVCLLL